MDLSFELHGDLHSLHWNGGDSSPKHWGYRLQILIGPYANFDWNLAENPPYPKHSSWNSPRMQSGWFPLARYPVLWASRLHRLIACSLVATSHWLNNTYLPARYSPDCGTALRVMSEALLKEWRRRLAASSALRPWPAPAVSLAPLHMPYSLSRFHTCLHR